MILVPLLCAVVGIFLIRSTRFPAQESAGTNRLSGVLAASALLWVFGAVLAMFFVPVIVQESTTSSSGSDVVTATRETAPLLQVSGQAQAAVVAVAALAVIVGFRMGRPPRSTLFVVAYIAIVFCVISGLSIGLFFLAVPVLLLAAGATSPRPLPGVPVASTGVR